MLAGGPIQGDFDLTVGRLNLGDSVRLLGRPAGSRHRPTGRDQFGDQGLGTVAEAEAEQALLGRRGLGRRGLGHSAGSCLGLQHGCTQDSCFWGRRV